MMCICGYTVRICGVFIEKQHTRFDIIYNIINNTQDPEVKRILLCGFFGCDMCLAVEND